MNEEKAAIVWQGPPDPERGIYYPIVSPKPGREVVGVILSETVTGVMTYYAESAEMGGKGKTLPCLGTVEKCDGCRLKREHRWKGYLPLWDAKGGRLALAEITREAYLRCPAFEVYKGQLRGKQLRLSRSGDAKNSRVTANVSPTSVDVGRLPVCFNVQTALERIWLGMGTPSAAQPQADRNTAKQDELFGKAGPYDR